MVGGGGPTAGVGGVSPPMGVAGGMGKGEGVMRAQTVAVAAQFSRVGVAVGGEVVTLPGEVGVANGDESSAVGAPW